MISLSNLFEFNTTATLSANISTIKADHQYDTDLNAEKMKWSTSATPKHVVGGTPPTDTMHRPSAYKPSNTTRTDTHGVKHPVNQAGETKEAVAPTEVEKPKPTVNTATAGVPVKPPVTPPAEAANIQHDLTTGQHVSAAGQHLATDTGNVASGAIKHLGNFAHDHPVAGAIGAGLAAGAGIHKFMNRNKSN